MRLSFVDMAYMAGMLHDIGILLLTAHAPDKYAAVTRRSEEEGVPICQAEQESFGTSHMEVGAFLLGIWNLPQPIVETALYHHDPSEFGTPDQVTVLTIVHIANHISQLLGGAAPAGAIDALDNEYLAVLGIAGRVEAMQQVVALELADV